MKAINQKYYNLDDPIQASYVNWDLSDSGGVQVPNLVTTGDMESTKDDLDKLIKKVIEGYEL